MKKSLIALSVFTLLATPIFAQFSSKPQEANPRLEFSGLLMKEGTTLKLRTTGLSTSDDLTIQLNPKNAPLERSLEKVLTALEGQFVTIKGSYNRKEKTISFPSSFNYSWSPYLEVPFTGVLNKNETGLYNLILGEDSKYIAFPANLLETAETLAGKTVQLSGHYRNGTVFVASIRERVVSNPVPMPIRPLPDDSK